MAIKSSVYPSLSWWVSTTHYGRWIIQHSLCYKSCKLNSTYLKWLISFFNKEFLTQSLNILLFCSMKSFELLNANLRFRIDYDYDCDWRIKNAFDCFSFRRSSSKRSQVKSLRTCAIWVISWKWLVLVYIENSVIFEQWTCRLFVWFCSVTIDATKYTVYSKWLLDNKHCSDETPKV